MNNPKMPNIDLCDVQTKKKKFEIFEKVVFCTCEGCLKGFTTIKNIEHLRQMFDDIVDDF